MLLTIINVSRRSSAVAPGDGRSTTQRLPRLGNVLPAVLPGCRALLLVRPASRCEVFCMYPCLDVVGRLVVHRASYVLEMTRLYMYIYNVVLNVY